MEVLRASTAPDHIEVYGFIRSPVDERGSSCRNTSRSVQVGTSFSMPITVIRVRGSVRHIRPLPSDSTTDSVPVVATAKLAPEIGDLGGQELLPQVPARRLGQRRGSSVRSAGAGSPTEAISRRKISRISARLRWIAGTRMCDGLVVPELHDQLGQVGLPGGDPGRLQRLVEPDLLGRHRLDLDHLVGAGRADERR